MSARPIKRAARVVLACVRGPETDEPVDESVHLPDATRRDETVAQQRASTLDVAEQQRRKEQGDGAGRKLVLHEP